MPTKEKRSKRKSEPPLRLEWVDPASLTPNPKNWRRHPKEQISALESLLNDVGWAGALLYNERTGRLIDGHARRLVAKGPVPVLVGNWSEEQEAKILATLDPIGYMAETSEAELSALVKELENSDLDANIQNFLSSVLEESDQIQRDLQKESEDAVSFLSESSEDDLDSVGMAFGEEDSPTVVEPDIPTVDIKVSRKTFFDRLSPCFGFPGLPENAFLSDVGSVKVWSGQDVSSETCLWVFPYERGSFSPEDASGHVLGLAPMEWVTLDTMFRIPHSTLSKILGFNWSAFIEPDPGLFIGVPFAVSISRIYKSRWVARAILDSKKNISIIPHIPVCSVPSQLQKIFVSDVLSPLRNAPVVATTFRRGAGLVPIPEQQAEWVNSFLSCLSTLRGDSRKTVLLFESSGISDLSSLEAAVSGYNWNIVFL